MDARLLRDIGLVVLANGVVAMSFGALAVAGGQPTWVPLAMSLAVYAGGAQFAALGVVLAGGNAVTAAVTGLLLNARLLPFGFSVADVLRVRLPARLLASHLLTDESVAFAGTQRDLSRRRAAYLTSGAPMFAVWNLATLLGVLAGRAGGDPSVLGLDAASPMVLLALVVPALRDARTRRAAALGAAVALACTSFLPAGLPVLCAPVGLLAGYPFGAGRPVGRAGRA